MPHRHSLSVLPTFEMRVATGLRASISSLCHVLISFLLLQNAPHKQLERKGKLFWFVVSEISVCRSVDGMTEAQASEQRGRLYWEVLPLLFWFSPQHRDRATNRQGGVSVLG